MPCEARFRTCGVCGAIADDSAPPIPLCQACLSLGFSPLACQVCRGCWQEHRKLHYRPVVNGRGEVMIKPAPARKSKPKKLKKPAAPTAQLSLPGLDEGDPR